VRPIICSFCRSISNTDVSVSMVDTLELSLPQGEPTKHQGQLTTVFARSRCSMPSGWPAPMFCSPRSLRVAGNHALGRAGSRPFPASRLQLQSIVGLVRSELTIYLFLFRGFPPTSQLRRSVKGAATHRAWRHLGETLPTGQLSFNLPDPSVNLPDPTSAVRRVQARLRDAAEGTGEAAARSTAGGALRLQVRP
jgi:hypothetical protein